MMEPTLSFFQPARGYRFTVDSLVLAAFVDEETRGPGTGLELGSGVGVVSLLLGTFGSLGSVDGVEIQDRLFQLSLQNLEQIQPHLRHPVRFVHADARRWAEAPETRPYDLVFSNPPFFRMGLGHVSPDPMTACARHEQTLTARELARVVRSRLTPEGSALVVYPNARREDVIADFAAEGLSLTRSVGISSFDGEAPYLCVLRFEFRENLGSPDEVRALFTCPGSYHAWIERWVLRIRKPISGIEKKPRLQ